MNRKKVLIPLMSIAALILVLFLVANLGILEEKPVMQIDMKYSLGTKDTGEVHGVEVKSSAEIENEELNIKQEDIGDLSTVIGRYRDNPQWIDLDDYDLPQELFELPSEKPGIFDSSYKIKYAFIPSEQKHDNQSGSLISAVTVRSPKIKSLFNTSFSSEIKTYINHIEIKGDANEPDYKDYSEVSYSRRTPINNWVDIKNNIYIRHVLTFKHKPERDEVMLDSVDRGLRLDDVLKGIKLKGEDVFYNHYNSQKTGGWSHVSALEQVSSIEKMESISSVIRDSKVRQFDQPFRLYEKDYSGDFQRQSKSYGFPVQFIGVTLPEGTYLPVGNFLDRLHLSGGINHEGDSYEADVFIELSYKLVE